MYLFYHHRGPEHALYNIKYMSLTSLYVKYLTLYVEYQILYIEYLSFVLKITLSIQRTVLRDMAQNMYFTTAVAQNTYFTTADIFPSIFSAVLRTG